MPQHMHGQAAIVAMRAGQIRYRCARHALTPKGGRECRHAFPFLLMPWARRAPFSWV